MQQTQMLGASFPNTMLGGATQLPFVTKPVALGPYGQVYTMAATPDFIAVVDTNVGANTAPLIDFLNNVTWPVNPAGVNYGGYKFYLANFTLQLCAVAAIAGALTLRLAENVGSGANTYFNKQFVVPVGESFEYTQQNYMREIPITVPGSSVGYQLGLTAAPGVGNFAQLSATVYGYFNLAPFTP